MRLQQQPAVLISTLYGTWRTTCTYFQPEKAFLTFDLEVMTSKVVRFEVEGQRRVGLIQEQVDPGHLDAVPFKHRTQNLSGETPTQDPLLQSTTHFLPLLLLLGFLSPEGFLFHRRDDLSVYVHV